jgi:phosphatidylserine decarboxylase
MRGGLRSLPADVRIALLRLAPQNALSRAWGALARLELPRPLLRRVLEAYVRHYGVDLSEADRPLEGYTSVEDFFTRGLRPGLRPAGDAAVLSPADGQVHSAGPIAGGELLQAKGKTYRLERLLRDPLIAAAFRGGAQVTIYLHPRDYHRVHAPVTGEVVGMRHIPGHLFPVNSAAVARVDELFAVNERVVTLLASPLGQIAVVMVGAYRVGRISLSYDAIETNARRSTVAARDYRQPIPVRAGDEIGRFHLGSTVIVLFERGRVALSPALAPGARVLVREAIANVLQDAVE